MAAAAAAAASATAAAAEGLGGANGAAAALAVAAAARAAGAAASARDGKSRTIVFVNAIASARRVAATLQALGVRAKCLHAEMQQRQRLRVLDSFKSASADATTVLVATDVAARGLDIPSVNHVVGAGVLNFFRRACADAQLCVRMHSCACGYTIHAHFT